MDRRFEKVNYMMRLDPGVWPTKQKCATVSSAELVKLRTVTSVLRQGRVAKLHADKIEFEDGSTAPGSPNWLYVDCTSDGLASTSFIPIFQDRRLMLQPVALCQQVASAASIAALELRPGDDENKNRILVPVPHPNYPRDLFTGFLENFANDDRVAREGQGFLWQRRSRLQFTHHFSAWELSKMMWYFYKNKAQFTANLERFSKEGNVVCKK
jgi:hypothetical protein